MLKKSSLIAVLKFCTHPSDVAYRSMKQVIQVCMLCFLHYPSVKLHSIKLMIHMRVDCGICTLPLLLSFTPATSALPNIPLDLSAVCLVTLTFTPIDCCVQLLHHSLSSLYLCVQIDCIVFIAMLFSWPINELFILSWSCLILSFCLIGLLYKYNCCSVIPCLIAVFYFRDLYWVLQYVYRLLVFCVQIN